MTQIESDYNTTYDKAVEEAKNNINCIIRRKVWFADTYLTYEKQGLILNKKEDENTELFLPTQQDKEAEDWCIYSYYTEKEQWVND